VPELDREREELLPEDEPDEFKPLDAAITDANEIAFLALFLSLTLLHQSNGICAWVK